MLGAVIWGALSLLSFAIFIAFPSGPTGWNYTVLVPGFLSLAACYLLASPFRPRSIRGDGGLATSHFDEAVATRAEELRNEKLEKDARMLKHQSSRRQIARR